MKQPSLREAVRRAYGKITKEHFRRNYPGLGIRSTCAVHTCKIDKNFLIHYFHSVEKEDPLDPRSAEIQIIAETALSKLPAVIANLTWMDNVLNALKSAGYELRDGKLYHEKEMYERDSLGYEKMFKFYIIVDDQKSLDKLVLACKKIQEAYK